MSNSEQLANLGSRLNQLEALVRNPAPTVPEQIHELLPQLQPIVEAINPTTLGNAEKEQMLALLARIEQLQRVITVGREELTTKMNQTLKQLQGQRSYLVNQKNKKAK